MLSVRLQCTLMEAAKKKKVQNCTKLLLKPLPQPVQFRISWSEVHSSGSIPYPRAFHTACKHGDKIFIFGGANTRGEALNELFVLNVGTLTWDQPITTGVAPTRCHHAAVFVSDQMYVIGGWDGSRRCNDIWILNTTEMKWEEFITEGKEKMTAHSSHSATHVAEEEKIIVVGRQSGQRRWSDTHTLDLKTKKWRLESSTVKSRSGHSCSPLPDGSKLLIWGGRKSNDVDYVLVRSVVSSHYSFPPKQGPKGNSYHTAILSDQYLLLYGGLVDSLKSQNDVHVLDTMTMRWQLPPIIQPQSLPYLYAHTACIIGNGVVLVFGGMTSITKASNKLYRLEVHL